MNTISLTMESSLLKRLLAWQKERFPTVNAILCIFNYFIPAMIAKFSLNPNIQTLDLYDFLGFMAIVSMFLLLRIFDEHKDYELDIINYPERVLQSGLITLNHLKILGVCCLLIQIATVMLIDKGIGDVFITWAIMMSWALLMAKEFFVGHWLNKHIFVYAVSHMLIMPLIIFLSAKIAEPGLQINNLIILVAIVFFFGGFTFEITRKTRGKDEEREGVDSYSKRIGFDKATYLIIGLASIVCFGAFTLVVEVSDGFPVASIVILCIGFLIALKNLTTFLKLPTLKGRERNEKFIGVMLICVFVAIIIAVVDVGNVILAII